MALVCLILALVAPLRLDASTSDICRAAARTAAAESGVPVRVLEAISLTETGHKRDGQVQPWPWTVNMEGAGRWFDSRAEALGFAEAGLIEGRRSFDVGCFQINYKWHGHAFRSVAHMFDPLENARYAADFLRRLHDETGDWSRAAGAYHSRTETHASRYRRVFDRHMAALTGDEAPQVASVNTFIGDAPSAGGVPRENAFPLLIASNGTGALGSLVPLGEPAGAFISMQPAQALR